MNEHVEYIVISTSVFVLGNFYLKTVLRLYPVKIYILLTFCVTVIYHKYCFINTHSSSGFHICRLSHLHLLHSMGVSSKASESTQRSSSNFGEDRYVVRSSKYEQGFLQKYLPYKSEYSGYPV